MHVEGRVLDRLTPFLVVTKEFHQSLSGQLTITTGTGKDNVVLQDIYFGVFAGYL